MNLFGMIDESGGAMQAERMRAEVVAANMANAETTRTAAGSPYRRQSVVFAAGAGDSSFASQFGSSIQHPPAGFRFGLWLAASLHQNPYPPHDSLVYRGWPCWSMSAESAGCSGPDSGLSLHSTEWRFA